MTLGFRNFINGKPNYFIQKIWKGIIDQELCERPEYQLRVYKHKHAHQFLKLWETQKDVNPKIHTIREDPENRWKAGNDIHFVVNNRTSRRFQFAPVIKCVSVQEIEIKHETGWLKLNINGKSFFSGYTHDFHLTDYERMLELARNDGFDSIKDFFAYFNKDFKGKIIHWTDLIY